MSWKAGEMPAFFDELIATKFAPAHLERGDLLGMVLLCVPMYIFSFIQVL